ncbi:MAG TPA: hypothetical protein VFW40_06600 [Capsulimonadaceae bacterium]|nr:hypothetical protein [Capsulimonadaceae bacterium]
MIKGLFAGVLAGGLGGVVYLAVFTIVMFADSKMLVWTQLVFWPLNPLNLWAFPEGAWVGAVIAIIDAPIIIGTAYASVRRSADNESFMAIVITVCSIVNVALAITLVRHGLAMPIQYGIVALVVWAITWYPVRRFYLAFANHARGERKEIGESQPVAPPAEG